MLRNVRIFEWVDETIDRNADWSGWRMKGMEHFDPGQSFTIAHDALEHFTADETTLEQEMMALGSMFLIRVLGGWWGRENSRWAGDEGNIIADDVLRFLAERNWVVQERRGCSINEDMRDYVLDRETIQYKIEMEDYHTNYDGYESPEQAYNLYIQCMRWISKGYAKARKRWGDNLPYQLCDLFCNIQRKVEEYKHAEHGDTLTIQFSCQSLEYKVYHTSVWEDEDFDDE